MTKKKSSFKPSSNNPNFLSNTEYIDEKMKYDLDKVRKYPGHQKFGHMKVIENDFDEVAFVNFTDSHFFGDGFNDERCSLALDWIKDTANAKVVFGGDIFDIASLSGKTNPHQSVLNNASSLDLAASEHYIGKIANKTICGVGGNHDAAYANRLRDTGISPLKYTLEKFGIQYFEFCSLIELQVGKNYYNILLTHAGSGRNPLDGGAKFAVDFSLRTGIRVDAVFLGHNHLSAHRVYTYQYKVRDEEGKLDDIIDHQIQIFVDPSFQGENEFFLSKSVDRSNTNATVTVLCERPNPYYNKEEGNQMPYVLCCKRFPLLNEHSNTYTIPAQLYKEKMADKTSEIDVSIKKYLKESRSKHVLDNATENLAKLVKKGGGR